MESTNILDLFGVNLLKAIENKDKYTIIYEIHNDDELSILLSAIIDDRYDIVKLYLKYNIHDLNRSLNDDMNIITTSASYGDYKIFKLLLNKKYNINYKLKCQFRNAIYGCIDNPKKAKLLLKLYIKNNDDSWWNHIKYNKYHIRDNRWYHIERYNSKMKLLYRYKLYKLSPYYLKN